MANINETIHSLIKEKISPRDAEREDISNKYKDLSGMLKGVNFQSGSYARFTSITPVNDLDVIWELPEDILSRKFTKEQILTKSINPLDLDITDILSELADRLAHEYRTLGISIMKIEPQTHSVCVYFGPTEEDFSIDVVPAIPYGNGSGDTLYWVPEIVKMSRTVRKSKYKNREKINWVKSNPRGYIKEATELNERNANYRRVVKFCKKWKWAVKNRFPDVKFKSFHIEMINKEIFLQNEDLDILGGLKVFFGQVGDYIKNPRIKDKADGSKYIDDYLLELSQVNKNIIINESFKVVALLKELELESDERIIRQKIESLIEYTYAIRATENKIVSPISSPYFECHENWQ